MRTTLILNDELVLAAKRAAAERHTTLSAVVNDVLRTTLMPGAAARAAARFHMPVFHGDGNTADTSPRDLSRLLGHDELSPYAQ